VEKLQSARKGRGGGGVRGGGIASIFFGRRAIKKGQELKAWRKLAKKNPGKPGARKETKWREQYFLEKTHLARETQSFGKELSLSTAKGRREKERGGWKGGLCKGKLPLQRT